jgi:hypothetical protein
MKKDIKTFRDICKKNGMTREQIWKFSEYIHQLKSAGYTGSRANGDFTVEELDEIAKTWLEQGS